jgi:ABC-type transport system involved in cytochrome c biogenesis permease subunit
MGRILLIDPSRAWQAQLQEIVGDLASTGGPNWQQEARDRVVEANLWLSVYDVALDPDPAIAGWPDPLGLRELSAAWGQAVLGNGDLAATTTDLEAGLFRLADIEHLQGQGAGEHYPSADKIAIEQFYEASRIFTWTWLAYILGGILTGVGLARSKGDGWGLLAKIGVGVTILGMLLNCAGFGLRLSVSSWGAVTNFYETFIYVALIVAIIGVLFSVIYRNGLYAVAGGIGAGLCAMVGEAMPPDLGKDINRLQPVLRSSFWLWVHVKVIVASYGAFLLAWLLANIHLTKGAILGKSVPASAGKAIYRCLQVGVVLCVAGTLLGGVWADQAWGRFWGWDPKEVWALIIILAYLIPLHLRYIGVVQATGLAAWSIYGFASVVFSWYGVNFLLGAGLHSYGFGSGGQHIVLPICLAQIIITTVQLVLIYVRKQPPAATPAAGA